jgi:hypothetical protein
MAQPVLLARNRTRHISQGEGEPAESRVGMKLISKKKGPAFSANPLILFGSGGRI